MRLLLVEDDFSLSKNLKVSLKKDGFAVDVVNNGIDAEFMGMEIDYDMVILDLGLPQKSGLAVLSYWRKNHRVMPVLILTARDAWFEKVDGFKAGADDYLGKPFHYEELLVRIQALIRRQNLEQGQPLKVAGYLLDETNQCLVKNDHVTTLTGVEFKLLRYFLLHPRQLLSKSHLTERVYENDADKDSNVIEVYINRLRKKLGKSIITTRRGQGYLYQPLEEK
ncbi:MAG: response regulator transcription factor [Cocleimonas sp.]|nr:response regulator transcription factor [Cocleimonas sp.]